MESNTLKINKAIRLASLLLLFGFVFASCDPVSYVLNSHETVIEATDVVIEDYKFNYGNLQQTPVNIFLAAKESKLYLCDYKGDLYVIENGEAKKVFDTKIYILYAVFDDYLYYAKEASDGLDLYCYSFDTGKEEKLAEDFGQVHLSCDGETLYVGNDVEGFFPIKHGKVGTESCKSPKYVEAFGKRYILERNGLYTDVAVIENETITYLDEINEATKNNYGKRIFLSEKGVVINCDHVSENKGFLYFINGETNEVTTLLEVDAEHVSSTANVHDNKVYVSFKRYSHPGDKGWVSYQNDTVSGTYCIDLNTFEAKKINDSVYDALYIFDSTGIYATDNSGFVYKLGFDGQVVSTILSTAYNGPEFLDEFLNEPLG